MEPLTIAKAISDLGILIVCAGMFLAFVWKQNKKQEHLQEQLIEIAKQSTQSTQVAPSIADEIIERQNSRIFKILEEFRIKLKATRLAYDAYHNGTRDVVGAHILKLSRVFESAQSGMETLMITHQNMPRSIIQGFCDCIRGNKHSSLIFTVENLRHIDSLFAELLERRNVPEIASKAVLDETGVIRGILTAEFSTLIPEHDQETIKQLLLECSVAISEGFTTIDNINSIKEE